MQCLPTLAVTRKETGSLKYSMLQLGYMTGLAYVAAFIVYQSLRAAGWQ
jgi:ferrous iron transport protein B